MRRKAASVSEPSDAIFQREAKETLEQLEDRLARLDGGSTDSEAINTLFRLAHNLKGAALQSGHTKVGELAHVLEELLSRWRDKKLSPTTSQILWAQQGVELIQEELRGSAERLAGAGGAAHGAGPNEEVLRVPMRVLGELLNTVGEVIIARGRLRHRAGTLSVASEARMLLDEFEDTDQLYQSLQEQVTEMRLVSVSSFSARLGNSVRTVSRKLGKPVHFLVTGEELQLDASIADAIKDPLMHLVRNAVDHGLESPKVRTTAGKAETGTVHLKVTREAGHMVFEVIDDGGGIDPKKVLHKARRKGLVSEGERVTDAEALQFIFAPGFSTAEKVTEISGRGVGLDVVKKNVEELRGKVSVSSSMGEGTTFTFRVPLALTIMQAFEARVGEQYFVVPARLVSECIDVPASFSGADPIITLRNKPIPAVQLSTLFGVTSARDEASGQRMSAVIVNAPQGPLALVVDEPLGESQAVLKPLGPMFHQLSTVSGATVRGTGDVALVLDLPGLEALINSNVTRAA